VLLSIITHAITSVLRAAFYLIPQSGTRVSEDDQSVGVYKETLEDSVEDKETKRAVEDNLSSKVTPVEIKVTEPWSSTSMLALADGRVPLSLVPKHCSSSFMSSLTSTSCITISSTDLCSIVDLYCDDEFKHSLELQPHMLLYPVQGLTSIDEELCDEGSILSVSLASTNSSLSTEMMEDLSLSSIVQRER